MNWRVIQLLITGILIFNLIYLQAQGNKIKLDNLVWSDYNETIKGFINSDKEAYTYNVDGRPETIITYHWNVATETWKAKEKTLNIFSNDQIEEVIKSYTDVEGNWVDTLKRVYVYSSGLTDSIITYERTNNTQQWNAVNLEKFSYDEDMNLTGYILKEWNDNESAWKGYFSESYVYDDQNRVTNYISQVWDFLFEDWINYDQEVYNYGFNPASEGYTYYLWDEYKNTWSKYYKDSTEYSADNLSKGFLSWYWENGDWQLLTKEIHEFNINGDLTYFAEYDWNPASGKWDYYDKEIYIFDANFNLTEFVDYNKDDMKNVWIQNSREVYSRETEVGRGDLVLPFEDRTVMDYYFTSKINDALIYNWNESSGIWVKQQIGTFTYSDFNVVENLITPYIKIRVFPNPVEETFRIETGEQEQYMSVSVYNLNGTLVQTLDYSDSGRYNVASLTPGVYILKIRQEMGKTKAAKLIKR